MIFHVINSVFHSVALVLFFPFQFFFFHGCTLHCKLLVWVSVNSLPLVENFPFLLLLQPWSFILLEIWFLILIWVTTHAGFIWTFISFIDTYLYLVKYASFVKHFLPFSLSHFLLAGSVFFFLFFKTELFLAGQLNLELGFYTCQFSKSVLLSMIWHRCSTKAFWDKIS